MNYMVFDIGCIECGEDSALIGFYEDLESANAAAESARIEQAANWGGQHYFSVWNVNTKEEVYE
jgi:hypothetical protein